MRIRNVLQEYEVKLNPVPTAPVPIHKAGGKGEWKVYGDGTRQCKVSISRIDLPDDTILHLVINGLRIGEMKIQRGMARYKRDSEHGDGVPTVASNQVLQVLVAGKIILQGTFYTE